MNLNQHNLTKLSQALMACVEARILGSYIRLVSFIPVMVRSVDPAV